MGERRSNASLIARRSAEAAASCPPGLTLVDVRTVIVSRPKLLMPST